MTDDVVAELDAHIHDASNSVDYVIEWRRTLLIGLLSRARDEIVALRERCAASDVDLLLEVGRNEALEEAAQIARENGFGETAAAIRALKGRER